MRDKTVRNVEEGSKIKTSCDEGRNFKEKRKSRQGGK